MRPAPLGPAIGPPASDHVGNPGDHRSRRSGPEERGDVRDNIHGAQSCPGTPAFAELATLCRLAFARAREGDLAKLAKPGTARSKVVASHNVLGQVRTFTVGFEAEHGTDRPLDPVQMYEVSAGELRRLLDADVAGRTGRPPEAGDPARGIRYAGARLGYLLDGPVRTSG